MIYKESRHEMSKQGQISRRRCNRLSWNFAGWYIYVPDVSSPLLGAVPPRDPHNPKFCTSKMVSRSVQSLT